MGIEFETMQRQVVANIRFNINSGSKMYTLAEKTESLTIQASDIVISLYNKHTLMRINVYP